MSKFKLEDMGVRTGGKVAIEIDLMQISKRKREDDHSGHNGDRKRMKTSGNPITLAINPDFESTVSTPAQPDRKSVV